MANLAIMVQTVHKVTPAWMATVVFHTLVLVSLSPAYVELLGLMAVVVSLELVAVAVVPVVTLVETVLTVRQALLVAVAVALVVVVLAVLAA